MGKQAINFDKAISSYTLYTVLYAGAPIYNTCVQIVRLLLTYSIKNRFNVFYLLLYAFIFERWENIFKISLYFICISKVLYIFVPEKFIT